MKAESSVNSLSDLFKALGNPNRLRIYAFLLEQTEPLSVNRIEKAVGIKQSHLSQSLGILYNVGLLARERSGSNVYYTVNHESFKSFSSFCKTFLKNLA